MPEPNVTEYRLGELEKKVDIALKKLDELPDRLDQRYALKTEVQAVDSKVEEDREAAKTKRTGSRALVTGLVVSGSAVLLGGFITFLVWVVQNIEHVQNLGGAS